MNAMLSDIIEANAPIPTWFRVGGKADLLARPRSVEELRDLLRMFAGERVSVLGDGANLLVDDEGVDGLVLSLEHLNRVEYLGFDGGAALPDRATTIFVRAEAGARLPKLITQTNRDGLEGLEHLGGIPASIGGAVFMNAGGAFGDIAQSIESVTALTRLGDELTIPHDEINFDYRHSGLSWLIITSVEFHLESIPEAKRAAARQRLKDVMTYKKSSQPLREDSAGCVFKNPVLSGTRVSAGKMIDQSGCKRLRVGGAEVSDIHANFIVTHPGCMARDILNLLEEVRERVERSHSIRLEPEIAIWQRGGKA